MSVRVQKGGLQLTYFYDRILVPMSYLKLWIYMYRPSVPSCPSRPSHRRRRRPLSVRPSRRPSRRRRPSFVRPSRCVPSSPSSSSVRPSVRVAKRCGGVAGDGGAGGKTGGVAGERPAGWRGGGWDKLFQIRVFHILGDGRRGGRGGGCACGCASGCASSCRCIE
jgi:hypothetical protein